MSVVEAQPRRWTRDEYYRMADLGFFEDQRVELIDGEIFKMPPQKDVHAIVVGLVHRAVVAAFGPAVWVREQMPISLPNASEPEPDVSVVKGEPRNYLGKGHPRSALLVVEVSDTTWLFDRRRKASLYASAGIEDYWIVNLVDVRLEVLRNSVRDIAQPHGYRYDESVILKSGDAISPLAIPQSAIKVSDLLP